MLQLCHLEHLHNKRTIRKFLLITICNICTLKPINVWNHLSGTRRSKQPYLPSYQDTVCWWIKSWIKHDCLVICDWLLCWAIHRMGYSNILFCNSFDNKIVHLRNKLNCWRKISRIGGRVSSYFFMWNDSYTVYKGDRQISHYNTEFCSASGPWFNIKMSSYQYRKSHCGDKTILRPSYLHNGISYTGKMASLYWIRAHVYLLR